MFGQANDTGVIHGKFDQLMRNSRQEERSSRAPELVAMDKGQLDMLRIPTDIVAAKRKRDL